MKNLKYMPIVALIASQLIALAANAQSYHASIQSAAMDTARSVSSLNFEKNGLNFEFSLSVSNRNDLTELESQDTFSDDKQISCMESAVNAAKQALANTEHRKFLKAMSIDHVSVKLSDANGHNLADDVSYGPSIVDDPYFIINAVINKKGVCLYADAKQLSNQFTAWEKAYAKTKGLSAISKELAEQIANVNVKPEDRDDRGVSRDRRAKGRHHRGDADNADAQGRVTAR